MADSVRIEYPEGDYSSDIKRSDEEMAERSRAEQLGRRRGVVGTLFYGDQPDLEHKEMQRSAEEGMRLRRSRTKMRSLGKALSDVLSEPSKPSSKKRTSAKKR